LPVSYFVPSKNGDVIALLS